MVNSSDATIGDVRQRVEREGFAVVPDCLEEETLRRLSEELADGLESQRNLLGVASVRSLAASKRVREIMAAVVGSKCFAVRGIFFNKTQGANWKVAWHQDLTIAVRERREVHGFGPWTTKDGVLHVQPPPQVMSGMLAIRLHLDESGPENGPLRVMAGSHRKGRLTAEEIASVKKEDAMMCCVPRGAALLMRPLLLHASSSCVIATPRRVIHLEFAAEELPAGLEWYERA
jgi:ectoine hydroxylase-related dioxygenase (phytanoyl-CoA dioxygenase family)